MSRCTQDVFKVASIQMLLWLLSLHHLHSASRVTGGAPLSRRRYPLAWISPRPVATIAARSSCHHPLRFVAASLRLLDRRGRTCYEYGAWPSRDCACGQWWAFALSVSWTARWHRNYCKCWAVSVHTGQGGHPNCSHILMVHLMCSAECSSWWCRHCHCLESVGFGRGPRH